MTVKGRRGREQGDQRAMVGSDLPSGAQCRKTTYHLHRHAGANGCARMLIHERVQQEEAQSGNTALVWLSAVWGWDEGIALLRETYTHSWLPHPFLQSTHSPALAHPVSLLPVSQPVCHPPFLSTNLPFIPSACPPVCLQLTGGRFPPASSTAPSLCASPMKSRTLRYCSAGEGNGELRRSGMKDVEDVGAEVVEWTC